MTKYPTITKTRCENLVRATQENGMVTVQTHFHKEDMERIPKSQ